jgi:hypothetical protein
MRAIPKKLREEMANDPFYKRCCITGRMDEKIDFHHALIFAGRQVNEKFCILPLAQSVHKEIEKHKMKCDWIMLNRGTDDELIRYSKVEDLIHKRFRLNEVFGKYQS